jgi:CRISPR-associated endonuclease Csn1
MEKTLALDFGTNSIGWIIRDTAYLGEQFRKSGVLTFNPGVGEEKNVEYSFAAQRTSKRSIRRLYQARKYKLWETLEVLRQKGYCPISEEGLNQWRWYKKNEGYFRKYPVDDVAFAQWIKLDFNGDGKPDYTSPYQLRRELIIEKLDFSQSINKYKLGRALYHIAQHRAFKSSKKVNLAEDLDSDKEKIGAERIRESELTKKLNDIGITQWKTVGDAFAQAEIIYKERKEGRIRNNLHTSVVRKDLQKEVQEIFSFQGLHFGHLFKNEKGEELKVSQSPIFWQRPLRSQKGTIGKCTLEPSKYRCSVSHPAFEEFRAWSFLNNIKYRIKGQKESDWKQLDLETRKEIYIDKFFRATKPNFDFFEIYQWLKKRNKHDNWDLNYNFKTNVAACPVSAQLRVIFGDDWKNIRIPHTPNEKRHQKKDHYDIEDIWHVPFSCDDEDFVQDFAESKLSLNEAQTKKYLALWNSMPVDYGQLSILRFLRKGRLYTEAALLAKLPEVLGEELWAKKEDLLLSSITDVIEINRHTKKKLSIVNNLIAKYKVDPYFADNDFKYTLQDSDHRNVLNACEEAYGKITWREMPETAKVNTLQFITTEYQKFFNDSKRQFKKMPHLLDSMKQFLTDNFELTPKQLKKLYHPSQIEIYSPAKPQLIDDRQLLLLGSPKTGAFKNPMAMRALHELRKLVNYLIKTDQIDEHTRIVVELARELNDANKRWAYEKYQEMRKEENAEFAAAIRELIKDSDAAGSKVNPDSVDDIDKFRLWYDMLQGEDAKIGEEKSGVFTENTIVSKTKKNKGNDEEYEEFKQNDFERLNKALYFKLKKAGEDVVKKYKLWKEQNCLCFYTGKSIGITQLFKENLIDFEHTIPRSQSFDNSLENLTVCYADYNRKIKKNQIPFHLPNYREEANGYSAILPRLEKWQQRVADLERHIEYWKAKSKRGSKSKMISKTSKVSEKDFAIRQKHLWQFELDYWRGKLHRFTMQEVKSGFRNSQLVDTQIISKYALHYLKTVFNKVEVQKGRITADFRKIFGIQPLDERKDRSKHSHHAKDAMVLSVIPTTALREQILGVWNELEEQRALLKGCEPFERNEAVGRISTLEDELGELLKKCYLPNVNSAIERLDDKIIINNRTADQTLTLAKRRLRNRGKVVPVKDESGKIVYQTDENGQPKRLYKNGKVIFKNDHFGKPLLDKEGNPIPVQLPKAKWAKGDIIRGQLHKDSFYGAIKLVKKDEHGKFVKGEDGKFVFDDVKYVIREELVYKANAQSPGFKSLDDLESQIVDKHLFLQIKKQVELVGDFKNALARGIWMLNKNGEKANKIKRVRIYVRSTNPLPIKPQTNISSKPLKILDNREHRQSYWAANEERPYFAMYYKNGKLMPETFSLFEIAQRASKSLIPIKSFENLIEKIKDDGSELAFTLQKGKKIIFLKSPIEENYLPPNYLQKTLYKVEGFEEDGRMTLKYHLESREDKKIKETMINRGLPDKGATTIDFENPVPLLRLRLHIVKGGRGVYNFAVEGKDFEMMPDGKINWKV